VSEQNVLVHNSCKDEVKEAGKTKYWNNATEVNGKKFIKEMI